MPEVHWKYTTKRIITTEWINGYKITDLNSIRDAKIDLSDIDRKLFTAFSEQIFNTGFVHADPHPGNCKYYLFVFKLYELILYVLCLMLFDFSIYKKRY